MSDPATATALDAAAERADFARAVAELCVRAPVSAGTAHLAKELSALLPPYSFGRVLTRGGWYRPGGVVAADGERVADDIDTWAHAELALRDDDMHALYDDFARSGLRATRLNGKTHYFVASTGSRAEDFVQVEIEEMQEVLGHTLFTGEVALSVEELADPRLAVSARAGGAAAPAIVPIGLPFHALRRVTDVAALLPRVAAQKPEVQKIQRFFDAWQASSAAQSTLFAKHWVLAVRVYVDQYHQRIVQALPVAAVQGTAARFDGVFGVRGMGLYAALQRFDRQAGYPMAWFFHMLTSKNVPFAVANAVVDDTQAGFRYLPERDVKVVKDWLHRPFGL